MTPAEIRTDFEAEVRLAGSPEGGAHNLLQEQCVSGLGCAIDRIARAILAESVNERVIELLRAADDLRQLRDRLDCAIEAVDRAAGHAVVRHSAGIA